MKTYFYKRQSLVQIEVGDIPLISQYVWQLHKSPSGIVYLRTKIDGHYVKLHRLLMGVTDKSVKVDHRDGCGLNNTRENLRLATPKQNSWNRKKEAGGSSQFKGVFLDARTGKWRVEIGVDYKKINLGKFDDEALAARAYDEAALKHHGEFARLNFPTLQLESA